MRLQSMTVSGFRCFGPEAISIDLAAEITALVGPNASGKTAALQALMKLFGVTRAQRTVVRGDFHTAVDADPDDRKPRELFIDVLLALPELREGAATPETVAPAFRHMRVEREDKDPVCRLLLEAKWEDDGTAEGAVEQDLFWIDSLDETPSDEQKHVVSGADRGLIQLLYTPASRDASAQVRATTGAMTSRLLKAIEWSKKTQKTISEATEQLSDAFDAEPSIAAIAKALTERWTTLHDDVVDAKPRISLASRRFEEIVNRLAVVFDTGPDGRERALEALSDGQQSLFYFALVAAVFDLERGVVAGELKGFNDEQFRVPALTIFALEEPENHLSPYYLARIVEQVRSLTADGSAQALVTSHSPAVLSRVRPREVRYCRLDPKSRTSSVKKLKLPDRAKDEGKYVRSAVLAYPELYFARFVLLVEGDSEQVVLPKLAESLGLMLDPAFVAVVPLGGRHVNHFWRLLNNLEIPYATLLDLDLGREGGGFGRIKYAIQQLIEVGAPKERLLKLGNGKVLSDKDFNGMHKWQNEQSVRVLDGWLDTLASYGVFFSTPLDVDLLLLAAFPDAYKRVIPDGGGPKGSVEKAAEAVFGSGPGQKLYVDGYSVQATLLPQYRYHFLTNSKPATHLAALSLLETKELRSGMPKVLQAAIKHVHDNLRRD